MVEKYKTLLNNLKRDHVSAYAAQAAFFIMLSFIPFILLLLTLIQYTHLTKADLYGAAQDVLPDTLDRFVIGIIDEVCNRGAVAISLSALTAVWSSGKAFFALTRGLNTIFDAEDPKGYVRQRLRATGYTLLFLVAIVLSLILLVFGNSIHEMAEAYIPLLTIVTGSMIGLKNVIMLVVLAVFFAVLYKFVPNHKVTLRSQFPGAVFSAAGWFGFSVGFSIYIDLNNGFAGMYGSLTTIILVMLWLYFCMYILLIGGEINSYLADT